MIKIVGSTILDEIVCRVKGAEIYSIMADETPDLSKTEQLAVLVRYVWNGVVEERLLAVESMDETTAEALYHTIRDKLQQCGIEYSNMRGQCYDGASNVSGIHTGLQARIKEISPSAIYTHCYAHVLNLVIVDTMSNNSIARDFFGTLQNLYVFVETCPKRHAVYLKHQRDLNASDDEGKNKREYVLKKLSDTRWACRAYSITAIYDILNKLNPRKAVGCDDISQRLLRISAPVISLPLTNLINHFIANRVWPIVWRSSNIIPVFKKADEMDKSNYRPVSVLPALSKIYERVMYDQIYGTVITILSPNISGYLKGHSCCTALLKMTDDWRKSLDEREAVAATAVDLSKAFDSVCHGLLLAKLRAYGFSKSAIELMSSYLCGRRQRVKLDNVYSDWRVVKTGVPQGSLLGPLLFNIYINDLNYKVPNTSLRRYADDTTEYASDVSPMVLEYTINEDLKIVSSWFESNYLKVNDTKTQAMVIGPSEYKYNFKLNDSEIKLTETLRILGVTFDRKLKFKDHIAEQTKKACAKASALRRLRRFIPQDVMIRLYKAYVLPHLEYCSPLLLGIGKIEANKLEDTNYYILRTILGLSKSLTYEYILKRYASMGSLAERRYIQSLMLVYKSVNNDGPIYINELFKLKIVKYNLRDIGTRLEQPNFNLEWLHRSFSYVTSTLWNNLPVQIRESKNIKSFKNAVSKHTF